MCVCACVIGNVLEKHNALRYVSVDPQPVSCRREWGKGRRERERESEQASRKAVRDRP